jgi:hypothetical protein
MTEAHAVVVGELMLALHTAVARQATPQLGTVIYYFARYHQQIGKTQDETTALFRRLLDQAVSTADLSDPSVLRAVDALRTEALSWCVEAYGGAPQPAR